MALYDDARPARAARRPGRGCGRRTSGTRRPACVVRDPLGRVFVHRRTDTKDVYPGRYDFTAGGVLLAGESPDDAAGREAEEELGVTSPLVRIGEADYGDDHTTYHAFLYETVWDGPVRLQPEEVASGEWMTLGAGRRRCSTTRPSSVMPDTATLLGPWVRARLADRVEPEQGWDSHTTIVEGRWVDRRAAASRGRAAPARRDPAAAPHRRTPRRWPCPSRSSLEDEPAPGPAPDRRPGSRASHRA